MKRLSLQWRITLMSVLLIGITCVAIRFMRELDMKISGSFCMCKNRKWSKKQ